MSMDSTRAPAETYNWPSEAGLTRTGTLPQAAASPMGYDQSSMPVRASSAWSRASFHTYTVPSKIAGPASGVSKSVWAPEVSHSRSPFDASHAWTPPPRVP